MKRAALALALVFGVSASPGLAQDRKAPDFALKDLSGRTVKLSDYKGKVVLINFWATWCPPCKAEIPDLVKVYDKYRNKGFVILGISLDDDPGKVVPPFVTTFKKSQKIVITYPILVGEESVNDAFGGIRGIPTTFLVDRKGSIRKKYIGPPGQSHEEIEAAFRTEITKLL